MSYTDWPAIIQEINQKYGTEFKPNETGPALKFLTDQYNGCASQAGTSCGVSQNVMYRACRRHGIETLHKFGPKTSWPDALIRINEILETAYTMDDFTQALRAIIDKEGGYKPAATAISPRQRLSAAGKQLSGEGRNSSASIHPTTTASDHLKRSCLPRLP